MLKFILAALLSISCLYAKDYIHLANRDSGLFSVFQEAVRALNAYEESCIAGVKVDFGTQGLYYERAHGPNWWEYYFDPIVVGNRAHAKVLVSNQFAFNFKESELEKVHRIIEKYIRIKPHITGIVDRFVAEHFQGHYVIGVHYRGTDKYLETKRAPYLTVVKKVEGLVRTLKKRDIVLFVATDEEQFLRCMIQKFGSQVCYLPDAPRAKQFVPVHTDPQREPYKCGESALVDCLLLSKTDFLLSTGSNLSFCSLCFNPSLKHKLIH